MDNNIKNDDTEISYGGCRYRMTYDNYVNPKQKSRKISVKSAVITLLIITVFIAVGLLIIKYYSSSVDKYFDGQNKEEVNAVFQSAEINQDKK